MDFAAKFDEGLSYDAFLAKFGNDEQSAAGTGCTGKSRSPTSSGPC